MDVSSFQILVLFSLMGGVIAYLGDWLGRKMGKKRLRLVGLRPRYTATVVTVVMGMLIPIVTAISLAVVSERVGEWLTRGTELVRAAGRLQRETEVLIAQTKTNRTELGGLKADRDVAKKQLSVARGQAAEAEKRQAEAQRAEAASKAELKKAEVREQQARKRITHLESQEAGLRKEVTGLQNEVTEKTAQLRKTAAELNGLVADREKLYTHTIELSQEVHQAERQKSAAEQERDALKAEARGLAESVYDLRQTISKLSKDAAVLLQGIEAVRTSDLVFRKGEELGRVVFPGGLTSSKSEETIRQLTQTADAAARERGVRPDALGRAAALEDRLRRMPDGGVIVIRVEDQVRSFVRAIAQTKEDLVMIATSFYNYFREDEGKRPVPLEMGVYRNRVVYSAGDKVAETIIDGAMSEEQILNAVLEFLRTKVREGAIQGGMLPVHGREASLGEPTWDQMLSLITKIRNRRRPVHVAALAAKETRSAEPLLLEFRVTDEP